MTDPQPRSTLPEGLRPATLAVRGGQERTGFQEIAEPLFLTQGYAYSKAMTGWGQTWTTANLDAYLAKPAATVPGTKMLVGVANPEQRAAVIAYLATLK